MPEFFVTYSQHSQNPMETKQKLLGKRVREARIARGLTQQELANLCCLNRSYISEVEAGKRNITISNAEKIALALQIDLVDLLKERK